MSTIHIHKINGKSFVSGLKWETLRYPHAYMLEARALGKQIDMDIVAIRKEEEGIQAGFVSKNTGVTKHMYSLAAVLADALPAKTWIGVFKLDKDHYALVAAQGGAILPQCDLVDNATTIRERLLEKFSTVDWQKVYLPPEFEFGGEEVVLSSLLTRKNVSRKHRLKPLTLGLSRREWVTLLSIVLCMGAAYAGWWAWQEVNLARKREVELRRQKALAELRARSEKNVSLTALHHPWAEQPGTPTFLSTCGAALGRLPLYVGGWVLESATCEATAWQATYERRLSVTVNDFLVDAQRYFSAAPQWKEGANKVTVGEGMTMKAGGDEALHPMDERLRSFVSALQTLDIQHTLTKTVLPAVATDASAPIGVIPFQTMTFSLSSDWDMPTVFKAIPVTGLRVKSLGLRVNEQAATLHWSAAGELYGK